MELGPAAAWARRRTTQHTDHPLDRLLAAKAASGTRIGVVLPALNEAATVGAIVDAVRRDLVEAAPLVDDLVVVDSGSTDGTAAVAAAAGARVVHREDVLPWLPVRPGKGEVLWRSLAATDVDLVVFVDADLEGFGSHMVTGLLGPLLADPTVHLVRGAYDREATFDGRLRPAGGGRVTELVARPLINLFWPELAAVQQPLGGEYAARRETLLALPFPCGYGVELGLLVDVWATHGLDAIAQVDLGTRRHRHQRDEALSLMSSALMQIALNRLERTGRLALAEPPSTEFARPVRAADGWAVQRVDVTEHERPPMAGLLAQHAAV